jgi:WD40 repeat protein
VFHPDGRQFAAFSVNGPVQFWSADSGRLLGELPVRGMVGGSFNPDGRLLALGNDGSLIQLWDVPNRRQVGLLEGHKNLAVWATFNPTGDLVASNGWESMLRLWDPRTERQLLHLPIGGLPRFNRQGDRLLLQPKVPELWEFADGREYRTFVSDPVRGKQVPYGASISPDGRFLAVGFQAGTVIWEIATGTELAYLRSGWTWHVLFQPSGDLLTSGRDLGLMRWPVRPNPDVEGAYCIGPPERLVHESTDGVAQSKDGRTVVVAVSGKGGQVVDLNQPGVPRPLLPHSGTNKASISPDGLWAATGCFHGKGINVWSVRKNKLVRRLPVEESSLPMFSRDGRWLATTGTAGLQLWKVGTWERGPLLPGGNPLFPPDSPLVGVLVDSVLTFMDPMTGRTVAALEDPNQDRSGHGCFNHDGTLLALPTEESYSVHVWDLRRIRAGLKAINLDWDAPDYPPAPPPHAPLRPFQVIYGFPGQPPPPPLVVLSPPRADKRPAAPAQFAAWVKQLADTEAKTRTEAAQALEEAGPPALKVLDKAAGHPDAAVRQRVQQVRDRIAVAEAVAPRRFSLAFQNTPLAEAITALADKAGVRLNYNPSPSAVGSIRQRLAPKTVTLTLDGVPFLEALDRLCQAADLVPFSSGPGSWTLQDGRPVPRELLAYAGPIRFQAGNMEFQRWLALQEKNQSQDQLRLHLSLTSEPRNAGWTFAQPRAVEARDDAGRSLLPDPQTANQQNGVFFPPVGVGYNNAMVLLQPPPVRGGTLKHLKIVLPVQIVARREDVLTVTDLAKAGGKTLFGGEGIHLKIQSVSGLGNNGCNVQFAVSAPAGLSLDPNNLGLRLTDARGHDHPATNFFVNSFAAQTIREPEAEDLLWLSGPPQGAFLTSLPWAALARGSRNRDRRQWTGFAQFFSPEAVGQPLKLTLFRFERLRTELPFDFRDLPLP